VRIADGTSLSFDEIITTGESLGSCEIYPLIKRNDEKYVTERGYFNPKFVEDVVRDAVVWLRGDARVRWFRAECEADESIHLHNAYAVQEEGEAPPPR
jgi:GTP cyclohydrolase I